MSSYKTGQHRVTHRGRTFHFVSYEAHGPNARTGEDAMPACWFLMRAGKRFPAIEQTAEQDPELVVAALTRWLDQNVFGANAAAG